MAAAADCECWFKWGIRPCSARFTARFPREEPMARTRDWGVKLALHRASTRRSAGGRWEEDILSLGDGSGWKPTGLARMSFLRLGRNADSADAD